MIAIVLIKSLRHDVVGYTDDLYWLLICRVEGLKDAFTEMEKSNRHLSAQVMALLEVLHSGLFFHEGVCRFILK